MNFLEKLYLLMSDKNINKNTLCKILEINSNSFVNWENRGTLPKGETLIKMANYFNVSSDYLLGLDDISNIKNDNINLNKDEAKLLSIFRELPPTFQSNLLERADAFKFANEVALNEEETA